MVRQLAAMQINTKYGSITAESPIKQAHARHVAPDEPDQTEQQFAQGHQDRQQYGQQRDHDARQLPGHVRIVFQLDVSTGR